MEFIELKASCVVRDGGNGPLLFAKIRDSDRAPAASMLERCFTAETTALQILEGLAVPTLASPGFRRRTQSMLRENGVIRAAGRRCGLLVESYEGEPFHNHQRSLTNQAAIRTLAMWLFCVEQFVAFRRHQLLYTDIKCSNVVSPDFGATRVLIVDFDRVVPMAGRVAWRYFGSTKGFDPPELRTAKRPSEASAVYQLGMLLFHWLTNDDNRALGESGRGLGKSVARLTSVGAPGIARLMTETLRGDPAARPRDFEAVLTRALSSRLPRAVSVHWATLRAPYRERLDGMGLRGPKNA